MRFREKLFSLSLSKITVDRKEKFDLIDDI